MKIFFTTIATFLLFNLITLSLQAQTVNYRFVFAASDCSTNELCFNVEAQGDQPSLELDEFNMRMFIDDDVLSFVDFRNPDPLYYLETGGNTQTGVAGSGSFFGFAGDFVYITDNYKRTGLNGIVLAQAPAWSYLFQACFNSTESLAGMSQMCAPLVWDHDSDGSGFAAGSDGIESLLVSPAGGVSIAVNEAVEFFNWDYFSPTSDDCFDPNCAVLSAGHTSFTANVKNCDLVEIDWEIEIELDVEKYLLERKLSFQNEFVLIDEITAIGTSLSKVNYHAIDYVEDVNQGRIVYRLSEKLNDGTTNHLMITEARKECGTSAVNIFPNPTSDYAKARFDVGRDGEHISLSILDMSGKIVLENIINRNFDKGTYEELLQLDRLGSGQYIVQLSKGEIQENISLELIQE